MKKRIRKIAVIIAALAMSFGLTVPVYAGSVSIYPESAYVNQGDSFTVYVTFYGNDIYHAYLSVWGDDIFSGGMTDIISSDGGTEISAEVTFIANGSGMGSIYVSGYTDEDEETWLNDSCTITVASGGEENGSGRGADAGADENYGYGDGTYINDKKTGEGSGNTNAAYFKLLGPDGKEILLVEDGNGMFSASVPGDTDSITIEAGAEDAHATVSGTGKQSLKEGLNTFEIVITAENGLQTGYQINITREKATASDKKTDEKKDAEGAGSAAKKNTKSGLPLWAIILIIVAVLAVAAVVIIILTRKHKNNNRPDPDEPDGFDDPDEPDDNEAFDPEISIDPYYAVTDISPELGAKIKAAQREEKRRAAMRGGESSETTILKFETLDHEPETETTILKFEDLDHRPETETTILKYEDMNHRAETETTILKFEDMNHRPETETTILKYEDMNHRPETETTILKYEDMNHRAETETTILKFEDMNHRPETETTILKFEDLNHRPETETTIIKFEDLENDLKDE